MKPLLAPRLLIDMKENAKVYIKQHMVKKNNKFETKITAENLLYKEELIPSKKKKRGTDLRQRNEASFHATPTQLLPIVAH